MVSHPSCSSSRACRRSRIRRIVRGERWTFSAISSVLYSWRRSSSTVRSFVSSDAINASTSSTSSPLHRASAHGTLLPGSRRACWTIWPSQRILRLVDVAEEGTGSLPSLEVDWLTGGGPNVIPAAGRSQRWLENALDSCVRDHSASGCGNWATPGPVGPLGCSAWASVQGSADSGNSSSTFSIGSTPTL